MKLLHRTSYYFLIFSLATLLVGALVISWGLNAVFTHQLDESLIHTRKVLKKELLQRDPLPDYLEIMDERISLQKMDAPLQVDYFKDTLLLVQEEEEIELEPFRQYIFSENIRGQHYRIELSHTKFEREDMVTALLLLTIGFLLLFLLFFNLFNRYLSQQIWRPFHHLVTQISSFDINDKFAVKGLSTEIDEFKTLAEVLEKMTAQLVKDYHILKQFSENAAHEIQTPLAIISSQIELLFQNPNLDEQQATHLQAIQNASQRLSRLNKSLLLLTKIENRQFQALKDLALHELIQQKTQVFYPLLEENQLNLELQLEAKTLRANPDLMDMLLGNILSNAIKHNQLQGKIKIILDSQKLIVQNTGKPLMIPSEQLFERFHKGEDSSPSLGLGLAIVKEICGIYGWKIGYSFEDDLHQLTINF